MEYLKIVLYLKKIAILSSESKDILLVSCQHNRSISTNDVWNETI